MKNSDMRSTRYLILNDLVVNPGLVRRLPPSLAFHYHVLPVARDNGHITVAMANPNDNSIRQAVADALDAELYVVQSEPETIDRLLAEVWPEFSQSSLRLLVYCPDGPLAHEVQAYAQYLSELLGGQLNNFPAEIGTETSLHDLVKASSCDHDLIIFGEPDQSRIRQLLSGPLGCKAADQLSTSVLVVRCPSWPLRKILFVTRGQTGVDDAAIDWMASLARASQATVTVLALVPAMAVMYQRAIVHLPGGLADWLTIDTPLGWQLRRLAQQLVTWETQVRLRFRQGSPNRQIRSEVTEGDYDLIVIAADPIVWWQRRLLGGLVNPLLRWAGRPMLIVKSRMHADLSLAK